MGREVETNPKTSGKGNTRKTTLIVLQKKGFLLIPTIWDFQKSNDNYIVLTDPQPILLVCRGGFNRGFIVGFSSPTKS